jgi:hypothetical protein
LHGCSAQRRAEYVEINILWRLKMNKISYNGKGFLLYKDKEINVEYDIDVIRTIKGYKADGKLYEDFDHEDVFEFHQDNSKLKLKLNSGDIVSVITSTGDFSTT